MAPRTRYALITGCGNGGIGEALAVQYTRQGVHAIATILPSESHDHLSAHGITWFYLDVTDDDSIRALKGELNRLTGGHLDVLVNNAGICYTMTAIDTDVKAVQRMFDVNLFGPMRMVNQFHAMLIKSSGTIVNIGSIGGIVPYVYGSSYNATKAGLAHWTNTLRVEMAPLGVKALLIVSGEVGTNFLKTDHGRSLPEGSFYAPLALEFERHVHRVPATTDRFAYAQKVVAKSLTSSPPAWFWTGSQTALIRFLDAFFPRTVFDWIFWNMFNLTKLKQAHERRDR